MEDKSEKDLIAGMCTEIEVQGIQAPSLHRRMRYSVVDLISDYALIMGACRYAGEPGDGERIARVAWVVRPKPMPECWFIARVPATINRLPRAFEWLKPAEIKRAEAQRWPIKRLGTTFFYAPPRGGEHLDAGEYSVERTQTGTIRVLKPGFRPVMLASGLPWRSVHMRRMARAG